MSHALDKESLEKPEADHRHVQGLFPAMLGSVGVVYGDIGTSPLYAFREALKPISHDGVTEAEVIGHTDTVGSETDNERLSVRRAEEVMTWLASQGFDRSQMSAVGRGERDLKIATGDNVDNAANRRVEVIVR